MKTTAPIILFVYNRLLHTQQVIAALKENLLSQDSELYIYADAAKDANALDKVNELRAYLPSVTGFKNLHISLREHNLGVDENVILGVTEIINKHGKAIVLEDDLVTSPWFLKYMNDALDFYENKEEVISIHGYVYPIPQKLKEVFFLKGADCWGWATWKRGWDLFEPDGKILLDKMIARNLQKEFDFDQTATFFKSLEDQANGKSTVWDIRWYAAAFLAGKLTLYPGQSMVANIGHDATGVHCGHSTNFDVVLAQSPISVETETVPDPEAFLAFSDFLKKLSADQTQPAKGILSRSFKKLKENTKKLIKAI
ncbi:glycosyltransferase family 2 protein [Pedobacter sp. N36a]|uniref:glycosyltransferase family 2 protein n=1 Tax=Pedobacter sp. N36a TaxID=2767996 RepID=UPI0016572563|nr:glycosyltransferase family 2 protein [Pedobacter sp. N36a]MBC8984548.1 glycosyltransferase family 2 protein [Pedobacter sp. N36a]